MSDDLKKALIELNQFRDWVDHLGINLKPNEVETYKADVINKIDSLISNVANGGYTRTEPVLPLQNVNGSSLNIERTRHYLTGKLIADSGRKTTDEIMETAQDICEAIESGYLNCR